MGFESIVSGYIKIVDPQYMDQTRRTIAAHPFDEVWPFSNIFWCDSPARYHGGVVAFAGSYKQIEEVWSEWLWKFSGLLQELEARDARVTLDCVMGVHTWRLVPKVEYDSHRGMGLPYPRSMIGQSWGIIEAPETDFSIDPEWLALTESNLGNIDEATGNKTYYHWDQFVERWSLPGPIPNM